MRTEMSSSSATLPRRSQRLKAKGGIAKKSTKAARTIRYGLIQQPRFDDNLRWTTGRFEKLPPGKRFSGLIARLTVPWSTEWVEIPQFLDVTAKAPAEVENDLEDDDDDHERTVSPSLKEDDEDEQLLDDSTEAPAEVLEEADDELARAIALSLEEDSEDEQLLDDSTEAPAEVLEEADEELARAIALSLQEDSEDEELLDVSTEASAKVEDDLEDSSMYDDEDPQFLADMAKARALSMIEYQGLDEIMAEEEAAAGLIPEYDDSLDEFELNGDFTTDYRPNEGDDLGFEEEKFEEVWGRASVEEREAEDGWGRT
ncbi:hypothetical protein FN846DRAFT_522550 [Sphaerosporella brunnea]|uniref:Uncharacterized protein n=1 Tax=Sphaerosporella brunnea TaxID=1250544 RepID=A0A5J5EDU8_9PEZI|nr:hypothetical protein FN846DRAFT_521290 [Sphaerosporella brunnea]KAA8893500.1 hypothetical protein FN846DRAFT_522550 [Sphaerosporella brunnea]